MNKQELIERYLKMVKLKDIIKRINELEPSAKQYWIDEILKELGSVYGRLKYRSGYEQGKLEGMVEREKVKVPQFVADWIEVCKNSLIFNLKSAMNLNTIMHYSEDKHKLIDWIKVNSNQETFACAWILGYEAEKEKRYKVVMPNVSSTGGVLTRIKHDDSWIWIDTLGTIVEGQTHTRKEIEDAGFGWENYDWGNNFSEYARKVEELIKFKDNIEQLEIIKRALDAQKLEELQKRKELVEREIKKLEN